MSTLCPNGVLPGRPDIEGIGTRVATYAQLLLAVFVIVFSPASSWFGSWWALLVTSLGLQLAAVASRNTITLLHALVVTWLAFPIFAMSWVYIFAHWRIDSMPSEVWLLTHLHGLVFVGFGLWIWSTAPTFGACPETNGSLQLVILGKSVEPLQGIRDFVLALYAVWALVFLLAAIIAAIDAFPPTRRLLLPHLSRLSSHRLSSIALSRPPNARPEPRRPTLALVTLFNVMMIAISIWSVEELLHRNISGASRAEDNQWTFGQIAAMILLAGPLFTFGRVMRATFWGETIIRSGSQQVLTGEEYTRGMTGENAMKNEKEQGFSTRIGEASTSRALP